MRAFLCTLLLPMREETDFTFSIKLLLLSTRLALLNFRGPSTFLIKSEVIRVSDAFVRPALALNGIGS
jgi:hypothetical protein